MKSRWPGKIGFRTVFIGVAATATVVCLAWGQARTASPPAGPTTWRAPDLEAARRRAVVVPAPVQKVLRETPAVRLQRLGKKKPTYRDLKHRFLLLNSPLLTTDKFGPVRFMHAKHAQVVGDCLQCHHARAADRTRPEITACGACHRHGKAGAASTVSLPVTLHRQCQGCHRRQKKGPTDCLGCHRKRIPDHAKLVKLQPRPTPFQVTRECLRCHAKQGRDMLQSAHWLWKGPSPYTVGHTRATDLGKATRTINNFCIHIAANWPRCTSCHAGYGWRQAKFDFKDPGRIDCLVCHDTTGTYVKAPPAAGLPAKGVDLAKVARAVGRPGRGTCGACHMSGGGGDAVKHGDMSRALIKPSRDLDVHMGGYDLKCHHCHRTTSHKIAGRATSVPVVEGVVTCESCHTARPHAGAELGHHLNQHVKHVACETCHVPFFARARPTKMSWDWSAAGDRKRPNSKYPSGLPRYDWQKGAFTWGHWVKPAYAWYNGYTRRYLLGDRINLEGVTVLTQPVGSIKDKTARIYPFKIHDAVQGADALYHYLLVPHLWTDGGFWKTADWPRSFIQGMKAAGLKYSGKYKWVKTRMYWVMAHQVGPAETALSCAQCHPVLHQSPEKGCARCHDEMRGKKYADLIRRGLNPAWVKKAPAAARKMVTGTDWLDFKALGYKGDPIDHGGRGD